MEFLVTVPANNARSPRYMEKALAAIHQASLRYPLTLRYRSEQDQVGLYLECDPYDRDTVIEPIVANYPEATPSTINLEGKSSAGTELAMDVELRPSFSNSSAYAV
ncbi:MAG: hypothetical protein U0936_24390 [Planctomycetaceae bacterium]